MALNERKLADYLAKTGLSFEEAGQSYLFECPKCGRLKLAMRRTDGLSTCWRGCEGMVRVKPEVPLAALQKKKISDVRSELYGFALEGFRMNAALNDDLFVSKIVPPPPTIEWPEGAAPLTGACAGSLYMVSRGVSVEIASQYQVRYCAPKKAVVFPALYDGRLVGWQMRKTYDPQPFVKDGKLIKPLKTKTSANFDRERIFLFENRITSDYAVVAEGPFDALKAHLCGGNVATMGKVVSKGQLDRLWQLGVRRLFWGLDLDAFREIGQLVRRSGAWGEQRRMRPPDGYDLGKMSMEDVLALYKSAPLCNKNAIYTPWS